MQVPKVRVHFLIAESLRPLAYAEGLGKGGLEPRRVDLDRVRTGDNRGLRSTLSRTIRDGGIEIRVGIHRLETTDWSLEVVDQTGASTVWDYLFPSDQATLDEVMKTIQEEGIGTFLSGEPRVIH
jgi:hypothetical protein